MMCEKEKGFFISPFFLTEEKKVSQNSPRQKWVCPSALLTLLAAPAEVDPTTVVVYNVLKCFDLGIQGATVPV